MSIQNIHTVMTIERVLASGHVTLRAIVADFPELEGCKTKSQAVARAKDCYEVFKRERSL